MTVDLLPVITTMFGLAVIPFAVRTAQPYTLLCAALVIVSEAVGAFVPGPAGHAGTALGTVAAAGMLVATGFHDRAVRRERDVAAAVLRDQMAAMVSRWDAAAAAAGRMALAYDRRHGGDIGRHGGFVIPAHSGAEILVGPAGATVVRRFGLGPGGELVHQVECWLDASTQAATMRCDCGETGLIAYDVPGNSHGAFLRAQDLGRAHIRGLPCIEPGSHDFIGYDQHQPANDHNPICRRCGQRTDQPEGVTQ